MLDYVLLAVAAFFAGAINSVAGGGTLITFPTLVSVLISRGAHAAEVIANATSTAALAPGQLAGAWGFRSEIRQLPRWALWLIVPGFFGGLIGALLLVVLPATLFAKLVPWLILTAAVLFAAQPHLARWSDSRRAATKGPPVALDSNRANAEPRNFALVMAMQFLISIYGGYFGAGMGILMLAGLGFMGLDDIHEMNALKNVLTSIINGVAIVVFVAKGIINWPIAALMAITAIAGGYAGARVARRLNRVFVRRLVVAIGFCLAANYFYKLWFTA